MAGLPSAKDRFTSVDTLALVRELRALGAARVDKAFDLVGGGWALTLRSAGEGRRELVLVPGRYAALVAGPTPHAPDLGPIAKELRRLLAGAALRKVEEPAGERYLEIGMGRSDESEPTVLALEIFGSGNLVVARGPRIVAVAESRRWAHRNVRVGGEYARPPSRADPWTMTAEEVTSVLDRSRADLASTLAARLGLGGPVAEELLARGGWIAESPASSTSGNVAPELVRLMAGLLEEVGSSPRGYVVRRGGVAVDATPYPSVRWAGVEGAETVATATFSEAAFEYFGSLGAAAPSPEEAAATKAREELERLAARQRRAVEELERVITDRKAEADALLAHYADAERSLQVARAQPSAAPTLELSLGDRRVIVEVARSPRDSAQVLYEEAKRTARKLEGARSALEVTLARFAEPGVRAAPVDGAADRRPSKVFWFEKYRWFISSEGIVVIAGRDAPANDVVVRRYLKSGDLYFHADLHGAPSVIAKRATGGTPIAPATIEEAAQWAVAFSKAWRAGLASASAFWVTPEQVSKAAASGEFVPRGAWVIHGTKNVLRDLPLELALGSVRVDGEERWTVAPERSVRARGTVRVLLVPGEERDRAEVERSLARDLGVSRSLLQALLPAGGITARRA